MTTLGSGDLRQAVKLPDNENLYEWLAVNSNVCVCCYCPAVLLTVPYLPCHAAVDFFNQINLLYGSIAEFCNEESCPVMNAGTKYAGPLALVQMLTCIHRYEYYWADAGTNQPVKLSAPDYMENLMTWVQDQLDQEEIFPSRVDVDFPPNFQDIVKNIFKRLFRVYAHIYHAHLPMIESLGEQGKTQRQKCSVVRMLTCVL